MSLKEATAPIKKMHDAYYSRTPILLAKIGDSLLIVSTSVTAYGIGSEHDMVAYISLFTGTLGKIILNFSRE